MKASKLKSGNYRVQVIDGYDYDGKRIVKSFTAPTEWEAIKLATDYREGRIKERKNITVEQAIKNYIESRENIIADSTLNGYNIILSSRLNMIKRHKIYDLDKMDIQKAINADTKKGLSHKSIKDALALLRSSCVYYDVNIPQTKYFTLPPKKPKKGDLPELSTFLDAVIGSSVELPCLIALWCGGMRISEVRGLEYCDISTDQNGDHFIQITRSRVFVKGVDKIKDVNKTYGSTRKVPLPKYLYDKIMDKPHSSDTDFIIDEHYLAIKGRFDRLMKKNGIKLTFHEIRSLFATSMNEIGVKKEVLQKLGGWTNSKVLDSVYIRHSEKTLNDSVAMLSEKIMTEIEKNQNNNVG